MGQNGARGFASYHRAHHVANRQRWRTFQFCFALTGERVGRFAGLADAYGQSLAVENGVAIAKLAAIVDLDLHTRQALDHEFPGQARMPARSAGHDAHLLKVAELLFGNLHFAQKNLAGILRNAAEQRVADGARLLENLLLHEMLVPALFGHDGIPGDMLGGALDRATVVIHHADALLREYSYVAIGQKKYLAGVLEERRDVAGHKKLAIAQADHGGRSHARGHDFVRVFRGHEYQRIDAAQFFQRPADCFLKRRILGILFDEVCDDFGVGFGDELMALALQLLFKLQIIFDDAVVNHHNLPGAVAMRVRVFFRGTAMRGPTCMSDSISAFNRRFLQSFLEVPQFSGSAADFQLAVVHYCNSGGVVAAVF